MDSHPIPPAMRVLGLLFLTAAFAAGCSSSNRAYPASARVDSQGGQDRYRVCHRGNTMTLPESAVRAHLRHGDRIGTCRSRRDGDGRGRGRGRN